MHQEQADLIAERIVQLGGSPQVDPSDLGARSQSRSAAGTDLQDMGGDDLLFVRTTMETCHHMIRYFETHYLLNARKLPSLPAIPKNHPEEFTVRFTGPQPL